MKIKYLNIEYFIDNINLMIAVIDITNEEKVYICGLVRGVRRAL